MVRAEIDKKLIAFGLLTLFATVGRYVLVSKGVQPFPNFEVVTVATFIGVMLSDFRIAMSIPLVSMICSDVLIGNPIFTGEKMNQIVMFTYSGFAMIALLGVFVRDKAKPWVKSINIRSISCVTGIGVILVVFYDIWTNFGWWYLLYPHTAKALFTVYALGLPFMLYHLISGITTFIFIGLPIISFFSAKQTSHENELINTSRRKKVPAPVILTILLVVVFLASGCLSSSSSYPEKHGGVKELVENVSLRVIAPNWNISYNNVSTVNNTVYDLLLECAHRFNFTVKTSYWTSYGSVFVESIGDVENGGNNRFWQYYVNGEYASVGCSKYCLHDDDIVEWRFEYPRWMN